MCSDSPKRGIPNGDDDLVVVALGSNLGDSIGLIRSAMDRLEAIADSRFCRSSLYRSSPEDCPPDAPDFVNAVVVFEPGSADTPEGLLVRLQGLEREAGRQRKGVRNEARLLDLDLIVYGRDVRETSELILPHPRARQRRFVLEPLAEVAPGYRFPGMSETVRELLDRLPSAPALQRLTDESA